MPAWPYVWPTTAYVLEVGSIALKGDAKTVAKDHYIVKAYLGG